MTVQIVGHACFSIRVYDLQGHSRSLPLMPFDRPHMTSY